MDVGAEEEAVVEHERVEGSLPPPPPPDQLRLARPVPARRLGQPVPAVALVHPLPPQALDQVLAVLRLLLGLQVVLQPVPGPPVALRPERLRKAALDQAALRRGKVLRL